MSRAKYATRTDLYRPFLERIYAEQSAKYKKDKDKIKAAKTKLHQAYGAYYSEKNIESAKLLIEIGGALPPLSEKLVKLSASSSERAGFAREFYAFIFDALPCEKIRSILDMGCGFNPFFLPYMADMSPKADIEAYFAIDIGVNLISLVNRYFVLAGLPEHGFCMDIISEIPDQTADLAFLFKIIPTLEHDKKGRGFEIMEQLKCKYTAVSFPTKTLGGKDINMADNYANFFEKNINRQKFAILDTHLFPGELVYVLGKLP